jgi:hypothetical protein
MVATNHIDNTGGLIQHNFSQDTITYVICKCTTNTKRVTSLLVESSNAAPTIGDPGLFVGQSEFKILIGIVYNAQVYQTANTLIQLSLGTAYVDPPTAGGIVDKVYLTWQFGGGGSGSTSSGSGTGGGTGGGY